MKFLGFQWLGHVEITLLRWRISYCIWLFLQVRKSTVPTRFLDFFSNIFLIWSVLLWPIYRVTQEAASFFFFLTLQYCIGFAIHLHESATGVHMFPILNPLPPSSLYHPSGSSQCTSPIILYPASNLWGQNVRRLCHRSRLLCKLLCHLGHVTQQMQWSLKCWQIGMLFGAFGRSL